MRALLFTLLFSCAPRTVDVLEPLATTPPGPGVAPSIWIPDWISPSVLCPDYARPVHNGYWRCPNGEPRQ